MRVTIIAEVLGRANNGTTVAAYNLINSLKAKGHTVNVVCPDEDKRGQEGYYILPHFNLGPLVNWIVKKNALTLAKFDEKVITEAVKDADVVHIQIPLFISRKTSKLVKKLGKPLSSGFHAQAENVTSHFGLMHSRWANHICYKWLDGNVYCRADSIHYPTQFIRDIFEKEVGRKTPGYVISNGVNSEFKPVESQKPAALKDLFCILFTGRLSAEKCHPVLINAVKQSKYKDRIQLIFAGDGPDRHKIEKLGKDLPNPPMIKFVTRDELNKIINYCDLYCHPSEMEIEAIACLEAISCGLVPVIANSPLCATKDFAIDPRCLFKVNDSKDLAQKIDWFIENPEEKEKLSRRYIAESKSFDQQQCMDQMEQMLLETAGLKPKTTSV